MRGLCISDLFGSTDNALEAARQIAQRGAPDIVVDATALRRRSHNDDECAGSVCGDGAIGRLSIRLVQAVCADGQCSSRILAVTAIDGSFFACAKNLNSAYRAGIGLYSGFYKALRREWRILGFHCGREALGPGWSAADEGTIGRIVAELCGSDCSS